MLKKFTYPKEEKLKGRKTVEQLFKYGKTFTVFPLKIFFLQPTEVLDFSIKAGVGVSSKNFKKAVDRNRIKRLLREAYRTEKIVLHDFIKLQNIQVIFFLLYIDKTLPTYAIIKKKIPPVLQKLIKELNENITTNN